MKIIKIENNCQEILDYLGSQGYTWYNGKKCSKVSEFIRIAAKSIIIYEDMKLVTWSSFDSSKAISFKQYRTMKRDGIYAGCTILLSNNLLFRVIETPEGKYVVPEGCYRALMRLNSLCNEDLTPCEGRSSIKEIRNAQGDVIWTKLVEMTVTEIETALKLTPGALRIKK